MLKLFAIIIIKYFFRINKNFLARGHWSRNGTRAARQQNNDGMQQHQNGKAEDGETIRTRSNSIRNPRHHTPPVFFVQQHISFKISFAYRMTQNGNLQFELWPFVNPPTFHADDTRP